MCLPWSGGAGPRAYPTPRRVYPEVARRVSPGVGRRVSLRIRSGEPDRGEASAGSTINGRFRNLAPGRTSVSAPLTSAWSSADLQPPLQLPALNFAALTSCALKTSAQLCLAPSCKLFPPAEPPSPDTKLRPRRLAVLPSRAQRLILYFYVVTRPFSHLLPQNDGQGAFAEV